MFPQRSHASDAPGAMRTISSLPERPRKQLAAGGGLPNEDISDRLFVGSFLFATQEPQSHSVTQTGLQAGDVNASWG